MATEESARDLDFTVFTKILKFIAYAALGLTLFLAIKTLVASPDNGSYISNRESFYQIGFVCTIVYFVAAYWVMHRGKSLTSNTIS